MSIQKLERILLMIIDGFLALTALAGGVGLLTGMMAPGVEMLAGSPFTSYLIPGLALLLLVGGSATVTFLLLWRLPDLGVLAAGVSALMILGFEIVEVLVIGSPAGVARNLQVLYAIVGLLMATLAVQLWQGEQHASQQDEVAA